MPTLQITKGKSSGLDPQFDHVTSIELASKAFDDGAFGDIYSCDLINGINPGKPLVIKILRPDPIGNHLRGFQTIRQLQDKVAFKDREMRKLGKARIGSVPALFALPQFSFEGTLAGQQVLGYAMYRLDGGMYVKFRDVLEDLALQVKYDGSDPRLKLRFAFDLVQGIEILRDMSFIHADINSENLFISFKSAHLVIIDYDSGAVTDDPVNTPTTWGKANDWVAPEITRQLSGKSNAVNVDLFTDSWSIAVGIHYLIFLQPPLFFLETLGSRHVEAYLAEYHWPDIPDADKMAPYFNQAARAAYETVCRVLRMQPNLRAIQACFEVTINEGYSKPSRRTPYAIWRMKIQDALGFTAGSPSSLSASSPRIQRHVPVPAKPVVGTLYVPRTTPPYTPRRTTIGQPVSPIPTTVHGTLQFLRNRLSGRINVSLFAVVIMVLIAMVVIVGLQVVPTIELTIGSTVSSTPLPPPVLPPTQVPVMATDLRLLPPPSNPPTPTPTPFPTATPTPKPTNTAKFTQSGVPHIFVGNASLNGSPASPGTVITAIMEGVPIAVASVGANGTFGPMTVPKGNGDLVTFAIGNYGAAQNARWEEGGLSEINLTASPEPSADATILPPDENQSLPVSPIIYNGEFDQGLDDWKVTVTASDKSGIRLAQVGIQDIAGNKRVHMKLNDTSTAYIQQRVALPRNSCWNLILRTGLEEGVVDTTISIISDTGLNVILDQFKVTKHEVKIYSLDSYAGQTWQIRLQASASYSSSSYFDDVRISQKMNCINESGRIAFTSIRDGNSEIYVTNADGSIQTNITNDSAEDMFPSWSPDGKRIAFSSNRDGKFAIYLMNTDGSDPIRITGIASNRDYILKDISWSPDGNKIAFVSSFDGVSELYIVDSNGSWLTKLTDEVPWQCPTWSPDSSSIALVSGSDGTAQIMLIVPSTPARPSTPGASTISLRSDECPTWSPDGHRIAFSSFLADGDIYLVQADGSARLNVTGSPDRLDGFPNWSPDGAKIAYSSQLLVPSQNSDSDIYIMDRSGTNRSNLTDSPGRDYKPVWSPDGRRIAFFSDRDGDTEIYLMNYDGTGVVNLTNSTAEEGSFSWFPR